MKRENLRILNNRHALYTVGHNEESQHGVGILVYSKLVGNIVNTLNVNARIAQITLKLNSRCKLRITQAYDQLAIPL